MGNWFAGSKNKHTIHPVIHVCDESQAIENTEICWESGTDGAFLINHQVSHEELIEISKSAKQRFPEFWIGVNSLGHAPTELFEHHHIDGIWVDNAGIEESSEDQYFAHQTLESRMKLGWKGTYFGGVAFKYQRQVNDLTRVTQIASDLVDVITTSGDGTGVPASVEKIKTMKNAAPDSPLAIASGITPENVADYMPYADCFLVATGISVCFNQLDVQRVRELVDVVRSYSPTTF